MTQPACMDVAEYREWCAKNDKIHSGADKAALPCNDCLASFALEMRAEGLALFGDERARCDGHPGGWEDDAINLADDTRRANAIKAHAARTRHMQERKERALELREQGLNNTEVGKIMGLCRTTIAGYVRQARM